MRKVSFSAEGVLNHVIEPLGAGQVGSEGFFDDHTRPTPGLRLVETALAQVFQDDRKLVRTCRKIVEAVAARAALGVQLVQTLCQGLVALQIVELAAMIENRRGKPRPQFVVELLAREFARCLFEFLAKDLVALVAAGESDHAHRRRQRPVRGQIVKGRNQLAMGQIAGGPEDHHGARLRHCAAR